MSTAGTRSITRVDVRRKHFGEDGSATVHAAVKAAVRESVGDPSAVVTLRVDRWIEEQDVIAIVRQPHATWWAYVPWPVAGPVVAATLGEGREDMLAAADSGLLCGDLQWNEGDPPEVETDF